MIPKESKHDPTPIQLHRRDESSSDFEETLEEKKNHREVNEIFTKWAQIRPNRLLRPPDRS